MADIFNRAATKLAGVFSADLGRLSFGAGVSTALVQNVNATYTQNVTRLYEVGVSGGVAGQRGTANVYYVGGRSQGTMGIARVIGPSTLLAAYYTKFGDVCRAKGNTMQLIFDPLNCTENGAGTGRATYSMNYCVLVQVGISVAAQDMVVNENSQLMFSGMEYDGPAAAAGAAAGAPISQNPRAVGQ